MDVLPVFFRLFACQDKGLRQLLFRHIIAGGRLFLLRRWPLRARMQACAPPAVFEAGGQAGRGLDGTVMPSASSPYLWSASTIDFADSFIGSPITWHHTAGRRAVAQTSRLFVASEQT